MWRSKSGFKMFSSKFLAGSLPVSTACRGSMRLEYWCLLGGRRWALGGSKPFEWSWDLKVVGVQGLGLRI